MKPSPPASALTQLMHALGKEYPYPGVEMQEQRAQAFYDAHKWKEARAEFEKLLTMLKDPANPTRQRAQLRVAECRVQLKGFAVADRFAEYAGPRSGCRAAVRLVAGVSHGEEGSGDVRGAEHAGAEISRQQVERRRLDGRGELSLGEPRTVRKPSSITSASWIPFRAENMPSTANGALRGSPI